MSRTACKIALASILLTLLFQHENVVNTFGAGRAAGAALAASNGPVFQWTSHMPPLGGASGWALASSSSDGTKLVAATTGIYENGNLFTSTDSGKTWPRQSACQLSWNSVASSSDGTKLVAAGYLAPNDDRFIISGVALYTSADSGATWTKRLTGGGWWHLVQGCVLIGRRHADCLGIQWLHLYIDQLRSHLDETYQCRQPLVECGGFLIGWNQAHCGG